MSDKLNCTTLIRPFLVSLPNSQYRGRMVQLETFQKVVKKIFSPKSFPAEYDSAIYLSEYDIANEFDLDILQMTLSLAHLVQKGIMSPLTQVYSTYKVGKVDEDAFSALTSKLESNSGTGFVLDDVEYTLEDLADFNQNALQTVLIVADHIRDTAKRKWTTIDAVSLSNKCACTPATIASTIGLLVSSKVCISGGPSKIQNRYKMAKDNVKNGKISPDELNDIAKILYDHSIDIESRGIARVNEIVSLLEEGGQGGTDVWDSIAEYFEENERGREIQNKNDYLVRGNDEVSPAQLALDDIKWSKIEDLVTGGKLPVDDAFLIARFATGVNSPRIIRLSLTKHILYGSMNHCNWDYVYQKAIDVLHHYKTNKNCITDSI